MNRAARVSVLEEFTRLLRPDEMAAAGDAEPASALRRVLGACLCFAAYGATAGLFQGGAQIAWAAVKTPLIVLGASLLCFPSLYVFATLAGARLDFARSCSVLSSFLALLGLLAVGLIPVNWLFSVSSRSLLFVVWLHVIAWLLAVWLGKRLLAAVMPEDRARQALGLWLVLFVVVSFQVATCLRPLLWRDPQSAVFETGRLFFMEHLGRAAR
jgi:hypothetical protein